MNLSFKTKLWEYNGKGSWYFVTLPRRDAEVIREISPKARGFGSIRVTAQIGKSIWQTSIFPDTKSKSYLLPVKKEVRRVNYLSDGAIVEVTLKIYEP